MIDDREMNPSTRVGLFYPQKRDIDKKQTKHLPSYSVESVQYIPLNEFFDKKNKNRSKGNFLLIPGKITTSYSRSNHFNENSNSNSNSMTKSQERNIEKRYFGSFDKQSGTNGFDITASKANPVEHMLITNKYIKDACNSSSNNGHINKEEEITQCNTKSKDNSLCKQVDYSNTNDPIVFISSENNSNGYKSKATRGGILNLEYMTKNRSRLNHMGISTYLNSVNHNNENEIDPNCIQQSQDNNQNEKASRQDSVITRSNYSKGYNQKEALNIIEEVETTILTNQSNRNDIKEEQRSDIDIGQCSDNNTKVSDQNKKKKKKKKKSKLKLKGQKNPLEASKFKSELVPEVAYNISFNTNPKTKANYYTHQRINNSEEQAHRYDNQIQTFGNQPLIQQSQIKPQVSFASEPIDNHKKQYTNRLFSSYNSASASLRKSNQSPYTEDFSHSIPNHTQYKSYGEKKSIDEWNTKSSLSHYYNNQISRRYNSMDNFNSRQLNYNYQLDDIDYLGKENKNEGKATNRLYSQRDINNNNKASIECNSRNDYNLCKESREKEIGKDYHPKNSKDNYADEYIKGTKDEEDIHSLYASYFLLLKSHPLKKEKENVKDTPVTGLFRKTIRHRKEAQRQLQLNSNNNQSNTNPYYSKDNMGYQTEQLLNYSRNCNDDKSYSHPLNTYHRNNNENDRYSRAYIINHKTASQSESKLTNETNKCSSMKDIKLNYDYKKNNFNFENIKAAMPINKQKTYVIKPDQRTKTTTSVNTNNQGSYDKINTKSKPESELKQTKPQSLTSSISSHNPHPNNNCKYIRNNNHNNCAK